MKKYYYIVFSFLLASGACTDLQENPIGLLAPESFFSSKADAEAAVRGGYAPMSSYFDYGGYYQYLTEAPTEMVQNVYYNPDEENDFTTSPNNGDIRAIWPNLYLIISASNNAIDGIPLAESMDETEKNQLIAEARALRAFTYFRLVRLFGDIPYLGEFVTNPSSVAEVTRTPASEVYSYIIEDLEFATLNLPDSHSGSIRSRISKGTAYTILADVYLTLGNWVKAAENAEYVINNSSSFGYALEDDFKNLFKNSSVDSEENIWSVNFFSDVEKYPYNTYGIGAFVAPAGTDRDGWSVMTSNKGTLDSFDDRDYRKKISFCTESSIGGVLKPYTEFFAPQPHILKYYDPDVHIYERESGNRNVIVYRYAEVLLIAAEALNEVNGGPSAKAYGYINQIRARARNYGGVQTDFPTDLQAGMLQVEFREAVLKERYVELAFEMKRWFDIQRRDLIMSIFGPNSPEPHPNVQPYHKLFPIPQSEIDKNPNLTQNPGYN